MTADDDRKDGPMPTREEPDLSVAEIRILDALWDRRYRARSGRAVDRSTVRNKRPARGRNATRLSS